MKKNNEYLKHLKAMIEYVCNEKNDKSAYLFTNEFRELRLILQNEYFLPFDREDIFLIAVSISKLFNSISNKTLLNYIRPNIETIRNIIYLFDSTEKNKYKKIYHKINDYYKIKTDDIKLKVSENELLLINDLIETCNRTVIQIEYTILKNS